ncbi:MAG TPA: hypothetical protein VID93_00505 [Acidimicrobiales bacterium]|jgi:hypothetical protein
MRVGVVGHGVVGRRVVAILARRPEVDQILLVSTRRSAVGTHPKVTAADDRAVRSEAEVVVLATPWPQHPQARVLLEAGRAVVTTSDDCADVEALLSLDRLASQSQRALVVGAAASPGLTGLLARMAADELDTVDEIHVAFHGTGGPACARQHHNALGMASRVWQDGAWQERPGGTGRELCWFPDPVGAHDCYRAALPDPVLLHRAFPAAARITARVTATRRDRLTARLPMLRPPHPEALEGSVRVEVRGALGGARETVVMGVAAPLGAVTGAVAATMALGAGLPPGLVVLGDERLATADLLRDVAAAEVAVHRFVGTASQTSW